MGRPGLSQKTEEAMKDFMRTEDGQSFFSQFAKKGDVVGGYQFPTDSEFRDKYWAPIMNLLKRHYVIERHFTKRY